MLVAAGARARVAVRRRDGRPAARQVSRNQPPSGCGAAAPVICSPRSVLMRQPVHQRPAEQRARRTRPSPPAARPRRRRTGRQRVAQVVRAVVRLRRRASDQRCRWIQSGRSSISITRQQRGQHQLGRRLRPVQVRRGELGRWCARPAPAPRRRVAGRRRRPRTAPGRRRRRHRPRPASPAAASRRRAPAPGSDSRSRTAATSVGQLVGEQVGRLRVGHREHHRGGRLAVHGRSRADVGHLDPGDRRPVRSPGPRPASAARRAAPYRTGPTVLSLHPRASRTANRSVHRCASPRSSQESTTCWKSGVRQVRYDAPRSTRATVQRAGGHPAAGDVRPLPELRRARRGRSARGRRRRRRCRRRPRRRDCTRAHPAWSSRPGARRRTVGTGHGYRRGPLGISPAFRMPSRSGGRGVVLRMVTVRHTPSSAAEARRELGADLTEPGLPADLVDDADARGQRADRQRGAVRRPLPGDVLGSPGAVEPDCLAGQGHRRRWPRAPRFRRGRPVRRARAAAWPSWTRWPASGASTGTRTGRPVSTVWASSPSRA